MLVDNIRLHSPTYRRISPEYLRPLRTTHEERAMERDFVILRDAGQAFPRDPFGGPSVAARGGPVPVPDVETATLGKADLQDVVRDPAVRAVAPVFPTR